MLTLIFFLTVLIFSKPIISVKNFLVILICASVVSSYIIASSLQINDLTDILIESFMILILYLFIKNYSYYSRLDRIELNKSSINFSTITFWLGLASSVVLLINIYIVYKSFGLISSGLDINAFKNEGEAQDYFKAWVSGPILSISHFLSPIGYICLPLYFYFLQEKSRRKSVVFFILSLNVPLHGLHALSRFDTISYILVFISFLIFCYSAIEKRIMRKILIQLSILITILVILLSIITTQRFSETKYYDDKRPAESLIQDKTLFSTFHYFSQWHEYGRITIREFDYDKLWYGKASTPILSRILMPLGYEDPGILELRRESLGWYGTKFNGLVSTLVYDFGFVFTLGLTLLFGYIIKRLAPKNGIIPLSKFVYFGLLINIPLMSFTNNIMAYLTFNLGIIYTLILNLLLKISSRD